MDNNTDLPLDKADLLERIHREWSALLQTIEYLSHEQMTRPGAGRWSIYDHVAHLTDWERYLVRHHLRGCPSHDVLQIDPALLQPFDEDRINAILHERHRSRTVVEVMEDMHRTHAEVVAALETVGDSALENPGPADDLVSRPLLESIVYNTYEHYQEHLKAIWSIVGTS